MPGTLIDAVIADAAVKGLLQGDMLHIAYEGMLHHANEQAEKDIYGRVDVENYKKLGYVPCNTPGHTVNYTLDAAYGDFCIQE
jgi:putative alpha-1,2-mannosidase